MKELLTLGIIGALIGWITNKVAIKLLFRPINPINIPFTGLKIHGLIPKRKSDIARNIGEVVSQELISVEDMIDDFVKDMDRQEVITMIKDKVVTLADKHMPPLIPAFMKGGIISSLENLIDENGDEIIDEIIQESSKKAVEAIDIQKIVEDKINEYDFEKIEEITVKIASNELKHIEYIGGVIGFFIGIFQGILVLYVF